MFIVEKDTSKKSPRYTLSDVYINNGKPFSTEVKISDKLMCVVNAHHRFNETQLSKSIFPHYDYLLVNVHDAYMHPRKPRGPFSIKKFYSSFVFIINDPQDRCRSFWKVLKYLWGEKNPDIKSQNYIDQLFKSEDEEISYQKEVLGDTILNKCKASRIMTDGNQNGLFLVWSSDNGSKTSHLHQYFEYICLINDLGTSNEASVQNTSFLSHSR